MTTDEFKNRFDAVLQAAAEEAIDLNIRSIVLGIVLVDGENLEVGAKFFNVQDPSQSVPATDFAALAAQTIDTAASISSEAYDMAIALQKSWHEDDKLDFN